MSDLAMERDLLRDALIGMVRQHCAPTPHTTDQYTHAFTGCEEDAFYALVECMIWSSNWFDAAIDSVAATARRSNAAGVFH